MIYGIISNVDEVTTMELFQSKKISRENIAHINQLSELVQRLKTGDVVHVISVNRFPSVSHFFNFGKFCMSRGVTLRILAQPYLDISSGKLWKPSVIRQMMQMIESERMAKGRLVQGFRMTNEQWEYVYRCLEVMNLDILAQTFSAEGVLKRGS